ncbi:MAG: hypothetical protein ACREE2_15970 [Stellaceae bacterium]
MIEIALGGLPPLSDQKQTAARLSLGEMLLAAGLHPRELLELCGLDPAAPGFRRAGYNADEPRVPAGNPDGGQWTTGGGGGAGGLSIPGVTPIDPDVEFTAYTPVHGLPGDAVVVATPDGRTIADPDSKTKNLMVPPYADFRKVYAAGRSIASLPPAEQYSQGHAAIAQGGTYDFQRDVKQQKFYDYHTPAANYAVGVYMSGAGYSLSATLIFAKLYALRNSSNYDAQDQLGWIRRGWNDGEAGVWR